MSLRHRFRAGPVLGRKAVVAGAGEGVMSVCANAAVVANKPREMTMCLVFMGCGVEFTAADMKEGADRSLGIRVIAIARFE